MGKMRGDKNRVLPGGTKLKVEKAGGTGTMRCPRCNGVAVAFRRPDGVWAHKCGSCGAHYCTMGKMR